MAFRVACFISMIWVPSPWRWLLFGAAVVLPAIAVMFANQADQRSDRGTFDTASGPRFSITGSNPGEVNSGDSRSDEDDPSGPGSAEPGSDERPPASSASGEDQAGNRG